MQETNFKANEKYNNNTYTEVNRCYKNTDENGMLEIIIPCSDGNCWMLPIFVFELLKRSVLSAQSNTVEKQETKLVELKESGTDFNNANAYLSRKSVMKVFRYMMGTPTYPTHVEGLGLYQFRSHLKAKIKKELKIIWKIKT